MIYNESKYHLVEPLIKPVDISKKNKKRNHKKRFRKNHYLYKSLAYYNDEIMKTTCTTKYIKVTKENITYKYYYHNEFKISEIKLNKLVSAELEKRGKRKYNKINTKLSLLHKMYLSGKIDENEYVELKSELLTLSELPQIDSIQRIDVIDHNTVKVLYNR